MIRLYCADMGTGWEGSAPGMAFLPAEDKEPFAEEFRKDLQFLELLILMISKSTVTGSLDITWVNGNDPGGLRHVLGTTQAARTRCSGYVHWDRPDPSQHFCNVVNDHGRRAADSCAICDRAAEQRVAASQQPEIYRCHAGLTGIAVPVVSGEQHIATLFSGAVLLQPQSSDGFVQIREYTRRLTHVDIEELERAYYEVPVAAREELENTTRVLELFAGFLARTWKRLGDTVQAERRRFRQSQLAATEFAYLALRAKLPESANVTRLLHVLGVTQYPNRVLVVSLKARDESMAGQSSFDLAFNTAVHAISEVAERAQNMVVAYLRQEGICVFLREAEDGPATGLRARTFAERALYAISSRCDVQARVGIGEVQADWRELADSYHQACCALTTGQESIAVYRDQLVEGADLPAQTELARELLAEQRCQEAMAAIQALPALAFRRPGGSALAEQRRFLLGAFESLCAGALTAGADGDSVAQIRADTDADLARATNAVKLQAIFIKGAETLVSAVRCLMHGKQEKLMERIQQLIEQRLARGRPGSSLSLTEAAQAIGKSNGHVSRMFHAAAGLTFSEYVQSQRIEAAKRQLLDPLASITEVSRRCGFTSPAYFARVFRKQVGRSPREYAKNPGRIGV